MDRGTRSAGVDHLRRRDMNNRWQGVTAVLGLMILMMLATLACATPPVRAHQPAPGQAHDQDAHHRETLQRGAQAMGFDQERTVHHFLLYEDGGAIDVTVKDANDHANLHAIHEHLPEIARLFKAGDFGKPALTHAQQVPGTDVMTRFRERIAYQYEETPTGGRVRIVTRDADALSAVHAFLRFQIEDHRTGDSGEVQRAPSEPGPLVVDGMGHRMGRGMMGMAMGHDAGTMAQMRAIHELFLNHDRITRTVTNLPDGIRTVTESGDPRIAQLLKDHVASMRQRVDAGDDPGLPIESDALRAIFQNYDKIETVVETTEKGVVVVQTSSDPATATALQQHASEVTDFVKLGMAAMRGAMMKNMGRTTDHGMRGGQVPNAPGGHVPPSAAR
jgi:hypothetical protein